MKTALVIGASRGIGLEFVQQLLGSSWAVYATARKEQDVNALNNLKAMGIQLDVTTPSS